MSAIPVYQNVGLSKLFKVFKPNFIPNNGKLKTTFTTFSSSNTNNKTNTRTFKTLYPPKDPPENYNPSCVKHNGFKAPDFLPAAIFRPFTSECEILGPDANKEGCYKNPEYFAYHRFSFAALQLACLQIREQRKKDGCKRVLYESEESDDEKCSTDET